MAGDTAVDNRHGPFLTMFFNHVIMAFLCFVLVISAFKWLYDISTALLFTCTAIFHLSAVYSYAYSQVKIDINIKGKTNYRSTFSIGLACTCYILVVLLPHIILSLTKPEIANLIAPFARLWNYPYFYFIYGADGYYFNYPTCIVISIIPFLVALFGYNMGIRKFSFAEKIHNVFFKKQK